MVSAALNMSPLSKALKTAEQVLATFESRAAHTLSLGIPSLDNVLPQRGLAYGSVVELQVRGASGAATSFALAACRAAQQGLEEGGSSSAANWSSHAAARREPRWCAFVDPTATLFAPGVARVGVDLARLLVLQPDVNSVERLVVRIAEARVMSVLVIDMRGALGELTLDGRRWQRTVRRLSLIIKQLPTCVLLITNSESRPALPLPVAMRLEFNRASVDTFQVCVAKERTGRLSPPCTLPLSVFHSEFRGARSHGTEFRGAAA